MSKISDMVVIKKALALVLEGDAGVVSIDGVMTGSGPEVHIRVLKQHRKRLRILIPAERLGVRIQILVD